MWEITINTEWKYNINLNKLCPATKWQVRTSSRWMAELAKEEVGKTGAMTYSYEGDKGEFITEWVTTELPNEEKFIEIDGIIRSIWKNIRILKMYLAAIEEG